MIKNDKKDFDFTKTIDKMSNSISVMIWVGNILSIAGIFIIAYYNWFLAIGVGLYVIGNNMVQNGKMAKREITKSNLENTLKNALGNMFGNSSNPK
jgi:hypothetical protein